MEVISERLKTAYTLLPPPLSALPAKYWTSISLLLHSYTVARAFQEFIQAYSIAGNIDAPEAKEAFVIGFLHDMGQKIKLRDKPSEGKLIAWVKERLEAVGFTPGEADELSRYLYTNPAEGNRDPLYDDKIWRLLWLADRLQGIENPFDIVPLLNKAKEDLGLNLNVSLLNVMIPQQLFRTLISRLVHEKINEIQAKGTFILPIATPFGLAVITDQLNLTVTIDWDDIRKGFDGSGIIPGGLEENLKWNFECCHNPECKQRCSKRSKPEECKQHGFTKRDCEKGLYRNKKRSSYEIALMYFGYKNRVKGTIVLPEQVKGMFNGVVVNGVSYQKGAVKCPVCGVETPAGVTGDFLQFFSSNATTEQWTRSLFPGSVNRLMQDVKPYAVDPLCLGEAIIRGQAQYQYLISLTVRALTPIQVLEEVGKLLYVLKFNLGTGIPGSTTVEGLIYSDYDIFEKKLKEIGESLDVAETPNYFYDAFSSTIIIPYRNKMKQHQDEWLRDIVTAGVLSAWGFYPITVSETVPSTPSETLLTYYKGRRPLYDYQPRDKKLGAYTPYVATAMLALSELNYRKNKKENLPALLEILDYPPEYAPLLVQYASPGLYSTLEFLRNRLG
ncbi:MAG: hypothetical protein F7C38_07495 [Desulfurococcales archaeon]|nr:hypothetical protein [Desulfurococcales archaeon]